MSQNSFSYIFMFRVSNGSRNTSLTQNVAVIQVFQVKKQKQKKTLFREKKFQDL